MPVNSENLIDPTQHSQSWLVNLMQQLGYQSSPGGICRAISHMAVQALLHPETDKEGNPIGLNEFSERIKVLNNISKIDMDNMRQGSGVPFAFKKRVDAVKNIKVETGLISIPVRSILAVIDPPERVE